LQGFDYREGYYLITICTTGRTLRFGELRNEMMVLNKAGKAVESTWRDLPIHYLNLQLDEFVTMPNHFHAIANLRRTRSQPFRNRARLQDLVLEASQQDP
jgi:REP element-mobilizing transposase RayT